jgi:hypothetical protein
MKFFFDRCVPRRIALMVNGFEPEHTIRHHDDYEGLTPTTTDVEWMQTISQDDPTWIVLSGDGRILKNKVERSVLEGAGLTFFCLNKAWMSIKIYEYAWKFMKVWPEILESAQHSKHKLFEVGAGKALKVQPIT